MTRGYEPGRAITPRIFPVLVVPLWHSLHLRESSATGCQFLRTYRTINWKRDACYLMLPSTPSRSQLLHPLPRLSSSIHTFAQNVSTFAILVTLPVWNSLHLADKAFLLSSWLTAWIFFVWYRENRAVGARNIRDGLENRDDRIKIFHAFSVFFFRVSVWSRLINIVTSSVHRGHRKLKRFAPRRVRGESGIFNFRM